MSFYSDHQKPSENERQSIYEQETLKQPRNLLVPSRPPRRSRRGARGRWLVVSVLLVLIIAVGGVFITQQMGYPLAIQTVATPTSLPLPTPSPTLVPTLAPTPTDAPTPTSVPTLVPTPVPTANLAQRIDTYINRMTPSQQIGQLLMLSVYTDSYTPALNQPLQQWNIANVILFNQYNGGPLKPTTLNGWTQLVHDLRSHANQAPIIATDEEGGLVDRLAPYYGPTPSPQSLSATGDPQKAYAQAQQLAIRLQSSGLNADFAPLVDVYQGGAVDQSRMFGTTPQQVITYAGAFLDGLQQKGVIGALKHWPGIGSASVNPDYGLPTITKSQAQLNAIDFVPFRSLLTHQPGMIMSTHAIVPAYDASKPASLSPVLVNQVLRGQLGYQNVVITDAIDAQGVLQFMQKQGYSDPAQAVAEASVLAILAGNDIILAPIGLDRVGAIVTAVTNAVQSGRISQERLRQSLRRIIALKARMGLIALP